MMLPETNVSSCLINICAAPSEQILFSSTKMPSGEGEKDADAGLKETFEKERDYLRGRLRDELRREPTEAELDEWLQQHTEGY